MSDKNALNKLMDDLVSRGNQWVVFDTETTGLDGAAEICQIGLLSPHGEVLMDQLIKPDDPIPAEASRIHGITNEMVKGAPRIWELEHEIRALMDGKLIVVYNAPFDERMLIQSFMRTYNPDYGQGHAKSWPGRWFNNLEFADVIIPYADYYGDWNDYHGNYRWQSLTDACRQQGLKIIDAHNAVGDCKMTLNLVSKFFFPPRGSR